MEIKPYTPISEKYKPLINSRIREVTTSPFRPTYHIAPPCGLANDPNGLCYVNGKYHVFYQWYPFEAKHDMKHWNHVSSKDLLSWDEESGILIPDEIYEKNGCYSGNAYVDQKTGKAYLYYTANYKKDDGERIPQQALAVMDKTGKIEKSRNNPIIKGAPENISVNIRDPFVFEEDDSLYMLLGAEDKDHKGCVLLYKALDFEQWEYDGVLEIELNNKPIDLGIMVECPGIILGKKDVLFLSLIGSNLESIEHVNRFDSIALIGQLDLKEKKFKATSLQTIDFGFDFYAPQPFYDKDKNPLFFGWFGSANEELPEDQYHWRHALTLPRNIVIEDGILKTPVHPTIKERFKVIELKDKPDLFESSKEPTLLKWNIKYDNQIHSLKVGSEDDYWELIIDYPNNKLYIDRSNLQEVIDPDYGMIRELPIEREDLNIDIFLDNSFNELYLNNGEKVLSFRSYEKNLY